MNSKNMIEKIEIFKNEDYTALLHQGKMLKALMRGRSVTQAQLAEKLSVTRSKVSRWLESEYISEWGTIIDHFQLNDYGARTEGFSEEVEIDFLRKLVVDLSAKYISLSDTMVQLIKSGE